MTLRPWEVWIPDDYGDLPLGGRLVRTDPGGPCPAPIAILGLYPAHTRTKLYPTKKDGTRIRLPVEVERKSFDGSHSGKELASRYLDPLGLSLDQVFTIDLYPYFLANTATSGGGRSMWDNVQRYQEETGLALAVQGRPEPDAMLERCRTLPGNSERLADWFARCRPRLVITLGNEVAAFVRGYERARAAQQHLYGPAIESSVFGVPLRVAHGAHPGVFVRGGTENPWIAKHAQWCKGDGAKLVADALRRSAAS